MSPTTVFKVEQCLFALASGVLALLAFVNVINAVAEWPMTTFDKEVHKFLGPWLLSLYSGVIGAGFVGLPVGLLCGYVCGTTPPHYSLAAMCTLVLPFFVRGPMNPSVYVPALAVGVTHFVGCYFGSKLTQIRGITRQFVWTRANEKPAGHVIFLDTIMLVAFCFLTAAVHASLNNVGQEREHSVYSIGVSLAFLAVLVVMRVKARPRATSERPGG